MYLQFGVEHRDGVGINCRGSAVRGAYHVDNSTDRMKCVSQR